MKRLITMVIMVLAVAVAMAQVPEKFTYQAVVRNASNALVANTLVGVRVSILQGSATGSGVYVETQMPSTNANGLITLNIGDGNAVFGTFGSIDWSAGPYFLKTEIDPAGGNNYSVTSTQQLLSVPYALYAKEAGNGFSGDYNDLTNTPTIPTVPTNVRVFTNDAGYLTSYTETDPQFNAWDKNYNDLTNKPVLFDGDYNSLTNQPTIPTVPTNVSAFTNDAGYITGYTEQQVLSISNDTLFLTGGSFVKLPAGFDGDYNSLTNKPTIPTVPTNVSAFTNDAGYITGTDIPAIPTVPTNVSAFTNDAGYLTEYTEQQVLSISNDTLFLTGGSYVKLPAGFDGDYNSLTNKPTIPTVPTNVSAFTNDAGYIMGTDIPEIPTVPTNVSAFTNDAGYLTSYTESQTLADVTSQGNSAGNRQLKDVSDPTESYDAVNLRTLVSHINSLQDTFQQQMQQMQQQMSQMQQKIDSLQNIVNSLDTNDNTPSGTVVIDEKSCPAAPTVTDHEGNVYATVQIGNQCWMRDNLRTTTSPSTGTYLIPAAGTDYTYTGKQALWYDNDSATYAPMNYGLLYNWNAAVDTFNTAYGETSVNTDHRGAVLVTFSGHRRGICPAGWHLPSDAEWNTMEATVSGSDWQTSYDTTVYYNRGSHAGKLAGGDNWSSSTAANAPGNMGYVDRNASGFSAVPAGYCQGSSFSRDKADTACFWSSSQWTYQDEIIYAYGRILDSYSAGVIRFFTGTHFGFSVRCLRDESGNADTTVIPTDTTATPDDTTTVTAGVPCPGTPTVTDHEGNVYATVQIGNQCWMRDNLRTTTSPSTGTYLIPAAGTGNTFTGKQAFWYNNDSATYAQMNYGLLYNWNAAVDTFNTAYGETSVNTSTSNAVSVTFSGRRRGICPVGWHLPSDAEWDALMLDYVRGQSEYLCDSNINYFAKALAADAGWYSYSETCCVGNDQSVNNATGFSAVPAGFCLDSWFDYAGYCAYFWSSSQIEGYPGNAWDRGLYYDNARAGQGDSEKCYGYSVRCLRDESGNADTTVIPTDTTATPDDTTTVTAGVPCPGTPTVTDHEGNVYATVQIGNQCWMRDNLRTTTSPSTGTYLIPAAGTGETFTGKQARWYNNDSATYAPMNYGLLYNWNAAVDTFNTAYGETSVNTDDLDAVSVTFNGHRRGICPVGWHLPSFAEWTTMSNYVVSQSAYNCGGESGYIAKALASVEGWYTKGWYTDSVNCEVGNDPSVNNTTGFSVVPAGNYNGSLFWDAGLQANIWSATQAASDAYSFRLLYNYAFWAGPHHSKSQGKSVRCLRDY